MAMLCDVGTALSGFLGNLTSALGTNLLLGLAVAIELFFVLLFVVKTFFSYELRLRRAIDRANNWIFKNKKIDQSNIKEFNDIIKKGPKRLVYFWQEYVLYREKEPSKYLTLDNLIEKPLKTSSFKNNISNLTIFTVIWALVTFLLSAAFQGKTTGGLSDFAFTLIIPVLVLFIGLVAVMILKAKKLSNLDEVYHIYHIFARFIDNACVDLPPYIDYDLLFSAKEIEKGNPQLREYYEARARQAKEEFERAKQSDIEYVEYDFNDAGVDGSLVLERAMKESEGYMVKKTSTLAKIAHVEAQQEALKRNYENIQKDLQKKIQASKENIQKLIQQQEATTNRMEVGFLRKQQEQEISKQEALQTEYDQEETRFAVSNDELNKEIQDLKNKLDQAREEVQRVMVSEYQSFYEKIMKNAYKQVESREAQKEEKLKKERENSDKELIVVQTQLKRLVDENETLRAKLGEPKPQNTQAPQGSYDQNGNYVYQDGSYHDPNGLFHDVDGKIYDKNGALILDPTVDQEKTQKQEVDLSKAKVEEVSAQELGLEITQPSEIVEEKAEPAPKKQRGRPRKPVVISDTPKEVKKRGRPRKDSQSEPKAVVASEKDGLPKTVAKKKRPITRVKKPQTTQEKEEKPAKTTASKPATKKVTKTESTTKKAPAKKTTATKAKPATRSQQKPKTSASKSSKAKTNEIDLVSLAKINKLITEEEKRLSSMKALVNSEISDALSDNTEKEKQEREEIMKTVEDLRQKAEQARAEGKSEKELSLINSRLEALIKELTDMNNKQN